ncbi:IS66 family insertion sequence element accessory protein TnpA [Aquisphaera insulae]|uniref:IS66 family insertion sequence element accessory protein TnpA n=1 Tax=Aquisphaera insulae TaxID=2712864 RepID=UPI0013E9E1BE|nr:hypothetical protein [Aquisphaera insulae]
MQASSSHREIDWPAVLADFRRSGMTHVQFCSAHGLSIHAFRRQLYRLRPGLPPRRPRAHLTSATRSSSPAGTPAARPAFLPVHIRPAEPVISTPVATPSDPIELVLGDRHVLRVPPGFDADSLGRLLDLLEDRP